MSNFRLGPVARSQLNQLALSWKQGEHVLITGGTGSGKTLLARYLDEIRIKAGGSVVVFVCKLQPDPTILRHYPASQGWKRWTTWKKKPSAGDNRILFWPKVEGLPATEALKVFRTEIHKALDEISKVGKWTVHLDEGLFITNPVYVGASEQVGLMYQLMRSSKGTMLTLAQRPSHMPLTIYSNIDQAFVSRAPNQEDVKRLANLDSSMPAKELQALINSNGKHDFTWLDIHKGKGPQTINLAK